MAEQDFQSSEAVIPVPSRLHPPNSWREQVHLLRYLRKENNHLVCSNKCSFSFIIFPFLLTGTATIKVRPHVRKHFRSLQFCLTSSHQHIVERARQSKDDGRDNSCPRPLKELLGVYDDRVICFIFVSDNVNFIILNHTFYCDGCQILNG